MLGDSSVKQWKLWMHLTSVTGDNFRKQLHFDECRMIRRWFLVWEYVLQHWRALFLSSWLLCESIWLRNLKMGINFSSGKSCNPKKMICLKCELWSALIRKQSYEDQKVFPNESWKRRGWERFPIHLNFLQVLPSFFPTSPNEIRICFYFSRLFFWGNLYALVALFMENRVRAAMSVTSLEKTFVKFHNTNSSEVLRKERCFGIQ